MAKYIVTVEATRQVVRDAPNAEKAGLWALADLSYEEFAPDWQVVGIQEVVKD